MTLIDAIHQYSTGYNLPQNIVMAIAKVESNLSMHATRAESRYRWLWDSRRHRPFRRLSNPEIISNEAPDDFPRPTEFYASADTEWQGQRTSWGPFQMMGAVLRERRYNGPFVAVCCDPDLAAKFACSHLSHLRDKYFNKHGWTGVVAAYNAGSPRKDRNGVYVNAGYLNKISISGAQKYLTILRA
jgi:hypothetical protein